MEELSENSQIEKPKKNLLLKVFILLGSILFTWFIVEIVFLNILNAQDKSFKEKCKYFDSYQLASSQGYATYYYYFQPLSQIFHCNEEWEYTYHINNLGLRDEKTEATQKDALAVGDSFTFGFGVKDNESFPALLNMYNAGIWGAPFNIQINSFKRNVDLLQPEVVVWSIYPSHIVTMTRGEWARDCPGSKTYFKDNSAMSNLLRPIAQSTYVPFMNNSSFGKFMKQRMHIANIESNKDGILVSTNCYDTKEVMIYDKNLANNNYADNPDVNKTFVEDRDKIYSEIKSYIEEAKKISDEKNIKIYFVVIPSRLNLKMKNGENIPQYTGADIDPDLPLNTLKGIITGAGFEEKRVIDLSQNFMDDGNWQRYYFEKDAHWNKLGHEFVAKIIEQKINELK